MDSLSYVQHDGLHVLPAQAPAHREAKVIRAFLLQPHVTGVVVGELHDQRACSFGKPGRDLFHELLLPLDIDRREELVFMNRLQQFLVLGLTLILGV